MADSDDASEIMLIGVKHDEQCIACVFTVERLAESLSDGRFTLCVAHLLRFRVHNDAIFGERSLRAVR